MAGVKNIKAIRLMNDGSCCGCSIQQSPGECRLPGFTRIKTLNSVPSHRAAQQMYRVEMVVEVRRGGRGEGGVVLFHNMGPNKEKRFAFFLLGQKLT